ncbi:MAG: hypothetical protein ABIR26_13655 [Ramlibacter sp.]
MSQDDQKKLLESVNLLRIREGQPGGAYATRLEKMGSTLYASLVVARAAPAVKADLEEAIAALTKEPPSAVANAFEPAYAAVERELSGLGLPSKSEAVQLMVLKEVIGGLIASSMLDAGQVSAMLKFLPSTQLRGLRESDGKLVTGRSGAFNNLVNKEVAERPLRLDTAFMRSAKKLLDGKYADPATSKELPRDIVGVAKRLADIQAYDASHPKAPCSNAMRLPLCSAA